MIRSPRPDVRRVNRRPGTRTIAAELEWGRRKLDRAGKVRPEMWALAIWSTLSAEKAGAVWLKRMESIRSTEQVRRYRRATALYADGAPFQSAVGLAEFRFLRLAVTRDVLIPRAETEELVTHVLDWATNEGRWGIAADIGTGTGAIALALATEGKFDRVIATDISSAALEVAQGNIDRVHPKTPVELRLGSLLEPLASRVNVLVSNPPYLTSAECEQLGPEVRNFEPRLALDGGEDGLDPYRLLIAGASSRLVAGGLLALEIDSRRPQSVEAMAGSAGWLDVRVINDAFGRARYLLATNGKREP